MLLGEVRLPRSESTRSALRRAAAEALVARPVKRKDSSMAEVALLLSEVACW